MNIAMTLPFHLAIAIVLFLSRIGLAEHGIQTRHQPGCQTDALCQTDHTQKTPVMVAPMQAKRRKDCSTR